MVSEQDRTLKAVQTAIQMEIDGKKFYQQMSRTSGNALGEKLFFELAAEEDIHKKKFEQIYAALREHNAWPKVEITLPAARELKTLFASAMAEVKTASGELSGIQTAMEMENKTHDFYVEQATLASFSAEKKYFETLAGQESLHHAALLDYYEYLSDPEQWFTMKERHSLDGG
jgi:rubrerythrin